MPTQKQTTDKIAAQATGVSVSFYNTLIAILTAITVVLGMRMMGALLISSLIIFPALSSMRLFKRFSLVILCAAISYCVQQKKIKKQMTGKKKSSACC